MQDKFEKGQFIVINDNDVCRFGEVRDGKLRVENHFDMKHGNFYGTPYDIVGELTPNAEMYSKVKSIRPAYDDEIAMYYLGMTNNK